jgi:hypothetical protein
MTSSTSRGLPVVRRGEGCKGPTLLEVGGGKPARTARLPFWPGIAPLPAGGRAIGDLAGGACSACAAAMIPPADLVKKDAAANPRAPAIALRRESPSAASRTENSSNQCMPHSRTNTADRVCTNLLARSKRNGDAYRLLINL